MTAAFSPADYVTALERLRPDLEYSQVELKSPVTLDSLLRCQGLDVLAGELVSEAAKSGLKAWRLVEILVGVLEELAEAHPNANERAEAQLLILLVKAIGRQPSEELGSALLKMLEAMQDEWDSPLVSVTLKAAFLVFASAEGHEHIDNPEAANASVREIVRQSYELGGLAVVEVALEHIRTGLALLHAEPSTSPADGIVAECERLFPVETVTAVLEGLRFDVVLGPRDEWLEEIIGCQGQDYVAARVVGEAIRRGADPWTVVERLETLTKRYARSHADRAERRRALALLERVAQARGGEDRETVMANIDRGPWSPLERLAYRVVEASVFDQTPGEMEDHVRDFVRAAYALTGDAARPARAILEVGKRQLANLDRGEPA